jgi:hypothetical protein
MVNVRETAGDYVYRIGKEAEDRFDQYMENHPSGLRVVRHQWITDEEREVHRITGAYNYRRDMPDRGLVGERLKFDSVLVDVKTKTERHWNSENHTIEEHAIDAYRICEGNGDKVLVAFEDFRFDKASADRGEHFLKSVWLAAWTPDVLRLMEGPCGGTGNGSGDTYYKFKTRRWSKPLEDVLYAITR